MRVSLFAKVTAILAMGLGATTSIEITNGASSFGEYSDKTAMAQISSWATPPSVVGEYESSLAQTEAGALGYKKVNTKKFFDILLALCKIIGN